MGGRKKGREVPEFELKKKEGRRKVKVLLLAKYLGANTIPLVLPLGNSTEHIFLPAYAKSLTSRYQQKMKTE